MKELVQSILELYIKAGNSQIGSYELSGINNSINIDSSKLIQTAKTLKENSAKQNNEDKI